jgi:hypothetical protein
MVRPGECQGLVLRLEALVRVSSNGFCTALLNFFRFNMRPDFIDYDILGPQEMTGGEAPAGLAS